MARPSGTPTNPRGDGTWNGSRREMRLSRGTEASSWAPTADVVGTRTTHARRWVSVTNATSHRLPDSPRAARTATGSSPGTAEPARAAR